MRAGSDKNRQIKNVNNATNRSKTKLGEVAARLNRKRNPSGEPIFIDYSKESCKGREGGNYNFLRTLQNLTASKTASECDFGPKLGLLYLDRRRKLDQW